MAAVSRVLAVPTSTSNQSDWNRKAGQAINQLIAMYGGAYATADRPKNVQTGYQIFDTTLGAPIWWNGTIWVWCNGEAAP